MKAKRNALEDLNNEYFSINDEKNSEASLLNFENNEDNILNRIKLMKLELAAKKNEKDYLQKLSRENANLIENQIEKIGCKIKEYLHDKLSKRSELEKTVVEVKKSLLENQILKKEEFELKLKSQIYTAGEVKKLSLIREQLIKNMKVSEKSKKTYELLKANLEREDPEFLDLVSNIKKVQKEIDKKKSLLNMLR